MKEQMIIAIGREFGSGGHKIGEQIAQDLGIPFYDRKLLEDISEKKDIHIEYLQKYDEKTKKIILSRRVKGFTNSFEEIVAEMQFQYLREKADSGESFVIIGRCADALFRGEKRLVSAFITGDRECKIKRIMEVYHLSREKAVAMIDRKDRIRKQYHNRHSDIKWGDSRGYDILLNSSKIGIEKSAKILEMYIKERFPEQTD